MVEVLVTGGAGFVGSHFVRHALGGHPDWRVTTLDRMAGAGCLENMGDVVDHPRHCFVRGDITDAALVPWLVSRAAIVVHVACAGDAGGSLADTEASIRADIYGTWVLLDAARRAGTGVRRFIQVSTADVYGSRGSGSSRETDELKPETACAASQAGADRLAYSFWAAGGLPVTIGRIARLYGPRQAAGELMPGLITRALDGLPLRLPGGGLEVRDWLHVEDCCRALDWLIEAGANGEVYNVGGAPVSDLELAHAIVRRLGRPDALVQPDAPPAEGAHRHCLDSTKARQLGWAPAMRLEEGLADTVAWYAANQAWWRSASLNASVGR